LVTSLSPVPSLAIIRSLRRYLLNLSAYIADPALFLP
jgi:hypothetical protein